MLMVTFTTSLDLQPGDPWDLIEFFGGRCKVARHAQNMGWRASCVDICYDAARPSFRRNRVAKQSPFDLNSDAGFALPT